LWNGGPCVFVCGLEGVRVGVVRLVGGIEKIV